MPKLALAAFPLCCGLAGLLAQESPAPVPPATPEPATATAPADSGHQDAAAAQLQQALGATAALEGCSFTAEWGPQEGNHRAAAQRAAGGVAVMTIYRGNSGKCQGAWADKLLYNSGDDGESVQCGRRTIARAAGDPWQVQQDVQGIGTGKFTPDPQLLLELLQRLDLAVAHRETSKDAAHPVELLSATLTPEQTTRLLWSGRVPFQTSRQQVVRLGPGGIAKAPAPPPPEATVDLVFVRNPATGLLLKVVVRTMQKEPTGLAQAVVWQGAINAAGGGGVAVVAGNPIAPPTPADEGGETADKAAPTTGFVDGLPVRPQKGMVVEKFSLELQQQGDVHVPELDAGGKALLRIE
jgi:hypothetical protein